MTILQRYFGREILRSVFFVMAALLALFTFFDMVSELQSINKGNYRIQHALIYVLLGLPGYIYEFMPIAVLIGTIYVLAQFASNSEFTIMRAASMSTAMAGMMLARIGLIFVALTFVFGEIVTPITSQFAEKFKVSAIGNAFNPSFKSGLWTKDLIRENGLTGAVTGSRFINIKEILPNRSLNQLKIFEFDQDFRMVREVNAKRAEYLGNNRWRLFDAKATFYPKNLDAEQIAAVASQDFPYYELVSEITPEILSALFIDPERMSALNLLTYIKHLDDNKQDSEIYAIAFWKKLTFPFAVLVMMALALPFAYLHVRSGGVSFKIFSGIMIGIVFYLINALFSHLGLLNTWPAPVTALIPSLIFLSFAAMGLRFVERN